MAVVLYRKEPPIARISLDRPHVLNAINEQMFQELDQVMKDFNADPDVKVGILSGEGDRAFSSGYDQKSARPIDEYDQPAETLGGTRRILEPFTLKPLIGAVHGHCVGHGLEWALHCDVLVASEDALLGLPEIRIGVTAGWVWDNLYHITTPGTGMKMLLEGRSITAAEARQLGLVQHIVPKEELTEEATRLAHRLAVLDSDTVARIKQVAYFWRNLMLDECAQVGETLMQALRAAGNARPQEPAPGA